MVCSSGLIDGVKYIPSPNCDARAGDEISLAVIHNISLPPNEFGGDGVQQLFTNCLDPAEHPYYAEIHQLRVSAHVLIRRDGELIQFVPFHRRAWHAGASCFAGREQCNEYSIGIELEGCDTQPFTDAQYDSLTELLQVLLTAYPHITPARITGHSEIAPGRKTDPGPCFDWPRLHRQLRERLCQVHD
ncbi:MAG: 1,6-anhydro-N-acetylmuramyl-L-alanine amidase AmpD [Gammaproteobacteria bacterium]|nr:MAG: 1,6-anhydro-N-acetylmuramyl-L-alanine amidase AmpD [Gammaproteobacteria bacterium]